MRLCNLCRTVDVRHLALLLTVGMIGLLATATVVERCLGTPTVERCIYHTTGFCLLWGLLGVTMLCALWQRKVWLRMPILLLHLAFVVILAGGLATYVGGEKGYLHLRQGEEVCHYTERGTDRVRQLPFSLCLDSFRVVCYPGTEAPADYVSYLRGRGSVSMNRVLTCEGYRLYQSSYDEDGAGCWLLLNRDPWGIRLTLTGYLLLGVAMVWLLVARREGFRRLLRHPLLRRGGIPLACLLFFQPPADASSATARGLPALARSQADSLARVQVIYHDRVAPLHTLARDFLLKLTGRERYHGLTPEQVLGGWMLYPEAWQDEPLIRVKQPALRRLLGMQTPYISFNELFVEGEYRLQLGWLQGATKDASLHKAIAELDEKVGLAVMLRQGTLVRPLPDDGRVKPLSAARLNAELLYLRIPFSRWSAIGCLLVGTLGFLCLLAGKGTPFGRGRGAWLYSALLVAATLFQGIGYGLRWYVGGRIPLGNGYETMHTLALCVLLLACVMNRRFPFVRPFGFLLSGCVLLVSYLGEMNPQITPLVPVLASPWLSTHVSSIMMAYSLLAFTWLSALLALCRHRAAATLMLFSRLLLYPALFFLAAGIFLGAVWANEAWGRYWAWDPKEVWALVTLLVYGAAFHVEALPCLRRPRSFHLYMALAFLTVLMTCFGVNCLLGGMHSYQ